MNLQHYYSLFELGLKTTKIDFFKALLVDKSHQMLIS